MNDADYDNWNVSLWINNDEGLYTWARELTIEHGRDEAARIMAEDLHGQSTPDGTRYTRARIYEALEEIV